MTTHAVYHSFPYIDLGAIEMREINMQQDITPFFDCMTSKGVMAFLADCDIPENLSKAENDLYYWYSLYKSRSSVYWAISLKNGHLIGTCGFNYWNLTHNRTELGYEIHPDYWNHGFATLVVKAMAKFAFSKMKVSRVQATVEKSNAASIRVLEKALFKREGLMINYSILHNKVSDFYMYAQIPENL